MTAKQSFQKVVDGVVEATGCRWLKWQSNPMGMSKTGSGFRFITLEVKRFDQMTPVEKLELKETVARILAIDPDNLRMKRLDVPQMIQVAFIPLAPGDILGVKIVGDAKKAGALPGDDSPELREARRREAMFQTPDDWFES